MKLLFKFSAAAGLALLAASYISSELRSAYSGYSETEEIVVPIVAILTFSIVWKILPIKVFRK